MPTTVDRIETQIRTLMMATGGVTLDQVDRFARPIAEQVTAIAQADIAAERDRYRETLESIAMPDLPDAFVKAHHRVARAVLNAEHHDAAPLPGGAMTDAQLVTRGAAAAQVADAHREERA